MYIKKNGMRPSMVRRFVLEKVCNLKQPFTADQLVEVCKAERISKGTVYNCLDLYIKAGILNGLQRQQGMGSSEYELTIGTGKQMQYICSKCGRTVEFSSRAISQMIELHKYRNFDLQKYSLIVYGQCKVCRSQILLKVKEQNKKL